MFEVYHRIPPVGHFSKVFIQTAAMNVATYPTSANYPVQAAGLSHWFGSLELLIPSNTNLTRPFMTSPTL